MAYKKKGASKIVKIHRMKNEVGTDVVLCDCQIGRAVLRHTPNCPHMNETFNKNHEDDFNNVNQEEIKHIGNNGEDTFEI